MIKERLVPPISGSFPEFILAHPVTCVPGIIAEAKLKNAMNCPRGYGTVTEGGYPKHGRPTAKQPDDIWYSLPEMPLPKRGEPVRQIVKASGNAKGSPQTDRSGT